jgi:hypothetical protein
VVLLLREEEKVKIQYINTFPSFFMEGWQSGDRVVKRIFHTTSSL